MFPEPVAPRKEVFTYVQAVCMLAFTAIRMDPSNMVNPLLGPVLGWFGKLSYPRLFVATAALFAADMLVPDFIPFVDELLLGLGTLLLANWKRVKPRTTPDSIDSDSRRG